MSEKFQNKYRIPSARATWHDYDGGMYFITICTANQESYFGNIHDEKMFFSDIGLYTEEQIKKVHSHYPYAEIPLWVVMPNHIHLIVVIDGGNDARIRRDGARSVSTVDVSINCKDGARPVSTIDNKMQQISLRKKSLAVVIGGIKSAITRYANANEITFAWQTRFHDRIIRNQDECNRIADYIETNIINWKADKFYRQ